MVKIRCGDSFGVDLNQVVAWFKLKSGDNKETINVILAGADEPIYIYRHFVGCQAFAHLHKLLLDQFAIDLASENNVLCVEEEGIDHGLVDELEDLPY